MEFFNNVAAIAVVLLFAKIVAHRSRAVQLGAHSTKKNKTLALLHVITVLSAAIAVGACLIATDWQSATSGFRTAFRIVAWLGVGAAGLILVADVIIDAIDDARRPRTSDGADSTADVPPASV